MWTAGAEGRSLCSAPAQHALLHRSKIARSRPFHKFWGSLGTSPILLWASWNVPSPKQPSEMPCSSPAWDLGTALSLPATTTLASLVGKARLETSLHPQRGAGDLSCHPRGGGSRESSTVKGRRNALGCASHQWEAEYLPGARLGEGGALILPTLPSWRPHHPQEGQKSKSQKKGACPFPLVSALIFGPVSQGNGAHTPVPCSCRPVFSLSKPNSQSKAPSPARHTCAQGGGIIPPPASPPPHGIPSQHRAPHVAVGTAGALGATELSLPVMPRHAYMLLPGRSLQPCPRIMSTCPLISPAPLCSSPCSHGMDVPRAHRTHQGWTRGAPDVPPATTACPAGRSSEGAHAGQCSRRLGAHGPGCCHAHLQPLPLCCCVPSRVNASGRPFPRWRSWAASEPVPAPALPTVTTQCPFPSPAQPLLQEMSFFNNSWDLFPP